MKKFFVATLSFLIAVTESVNCGLVIQTLPPSDLCIVADEKSWVISLRDNWIVGRSARSPLTVFYFGLKHNHPDKNKDAAIDYIKKHALQHATVFSNIEVFDTSIKHEIIIKGNFFNSTNTGVFFLHIALLSGQTQRLMFTMINDIDLGDEKAESVFKDVLGLVTPLYSMRGFLDGEDLNEELFEESLID